MSQDDSHNLEAVTEEKTFSDMERRKIPRIDLASEQFRLKANGKVFPVINLSPVGMALRVIDKNDLVLFTVGRKVPGTLNLRRQKFEVPAKVVNTRLGTVGVEFTWEDLEGDDPTEENLKKSLDIDLLASELHRVPTNDLNKAIWFHGPSGTDILYWRGGTGQIEGFAIYILGSFIRWEEEQGITTGRCVAQDDGEHSSTVIHLVTMVLDPDSQMDPDKLAIAKKLVLSSNLPQDLKDLSVSRIGSN